VKQDVIKYAQVKVKDEHRNVLIPIGVNKPDIPDRIQKKWQKIVDMVASIVEVPTGLITHLTQEHLEIFAASNTKGNPYKRSDRDSLGIGMFCETVAGKRHMMTVQDTAETEFWKNNPHAPLGMRSYMGVPIEWNDGEVFGTFCMLDDRTNRFNAKFQDLMIQFKDIIETDLENILLTEELKKKLSEKELQIREIHHRVKNHFNMLISFINLQSLNVKSNVEEILTDLENRVKAISIVHEELHKNNTKEDVDLLVYINHISKLIIGNIANVPNTVSIDVPDIKIPLDSSIPIGLILSELFSNSVKYAVGNDLLDITIKVKKINDNRVELNYRDNGAGYPDELSPDNSDTLGLSIIRMLTMQLRGTAIFYNDSGACYRSEITV